MREVRGFQAQGPYCLGGYCFGGNVAYEMARQLQAVGEKVALLALLDTAPANAGYEAVAWWRPHFGPRLARNFFYWMDDFTQLEPQARRKFIARKTRTLGRKLLRHLHHNNGDSVAVDLEEVIDTGHVSESELALWQIHLRALIEHV